MKSFLDKEASTVPIAENGPKMLPNSKDAANDTKKEEDPSLHQNPTSIPYKSMEPKDKTTSSSDPTVKVTPKIAKEWAVVQTQEDKMSDEEFLDVLSDFDEEPETEDSNSTSRFLDAKQDENQDSTNKTDSRIQTRSEDNKGREAPPMDSEMVHRVVVDLTKAENRSNVPQDPPGHGSKTTSKLLERTKE